MFEIFNDKSVEKIGKKEGTILLNTNLQREVSSARGMFNNELSSILLGGQIGTTTFQSQR